MGKSKTAFVKRRPTTGNSGRYERDGTVQQTKKKMSIEDIIAAVNKKLNAMVK